MPVIEALRRLGYEFETDGANIRFRFTRLGRPPAAARPLLAELQARKAEAIAWLSAAAPSPERLD